MKEEGDANDQCCHTVSLNCTYNPHCHRGAPASVVWVIGIHSFMQFI